MSRRLVVAVTGASGAVYASRLLDRLQHLLKPDDRVAVIFSSNAPGVWEYELQNKDHHRFDFQYFKNDDFFAGPASGSAGYDTMIICPASMGTLGRIASGVSDNLITRTADVMLKERKNLIVVPRETPLNLIHLRNLTTLAEAGATVVPASPSFYSRPQSLEEAVDTVVNRVLSLAGFETGGFRWGEDG